MDVPGGNPAPPAAEHQPHPHQDSWRRTSRSSRVRSRTPVGRGGTPAGATAVITDVRLPRPALHPGPPLPALELFPLDAASPGHMPRRFQKHPPPPELSRVPSHTLIRGHSTGVWMKDLKEFCLHAQFWERYALLPLLFMADSKYENETPPPPPCLTYLTVRSLGKALPTSRPQHPPSCAEAVPGSRGSQWQPPAAGGGEHSSLRLFVPLHRPHLQFP